MLTALEGGGGLFFRMLGDRVAAGARPPAEDGDLVSAVWDLVWAGLLTNDTLAPLRVVTSGGVRRPAAGRAPADDIGIAQPERARPRRARPRRGCSTRGRLRGRTGGYGGRSGGYGGGYGGRARRPAMPSRTGPPTVSGRWSLLPDRHGVPAAAVTGLGGDGAAEAAVLGGPAAATMRAHALALTLLERHGVLTRGAVAAERVPGGFAAVYPVLRAMEETGQCRRGYFVEGLGAAQFALPGAVDRMRAMAGDLVAGGAAERGGGAADSDRRGRSVVLAAADPAQPYGAALPWPSRPEETATSHRPGRKAGAVVVLFAGELALYVERGGKTLLSWTDDPAVLVPCAHALAAAVRDGALGRMTVEKADGGAVHDSPLAAALSAAGFRATPRGLRLRG